MMTVECGVFCDLCGDCMYCHAEDVCYGNDEGGHVNRDLGVSQPVADAVRLRFCDCGHGHPWECDCPECDHPTYNPEPT